MKVKLIVEGGNMKPGPAVAQQLGPLGINMGKVMSDVNTATSGFKGMNVPVEIDVNTKTKAIKINVFSPPVAELIKKEVSIEKGSGQPNTFKVGNIAFERLIWIAKTKTDDLLAKNLKSAVKNVVGSSHSMGVLVENKGALDVNVDIDAGLYDSLISNEKTEPSPEKLKSLNDHLLSMQEAYKAELERIKAEQEAKAAAEAAAAPTEAAVGKEKAATPAAEAAAPAKEKTPEEKKERK